MIKIPSTYLEVEYDINGSPFIVEKHFARSESLLLALALNNKEEEENA